MNRRTLATIAALLCLGVLVASTWAMVKRVDAYNRRPERQSWIFQPLDLRKFEYAGREVSITDTRQESGGEAVEIRYGDESILLPATIPSMSEQVPGLTRHRDWLKILRFAERGQLTQREAAAQIASGQLKDRLVAVVRRPKVEDPRTLGQGWRRQWAFDFYEFKPEGGFEMQTFDYPSGRTIDKPKPGHLIEGTWQFEAALFVMPKLGKPNPKFTGDALHAMGWTLPAAGFSGLGLIWALIVLLAAGRPRSA